MDAEDSKSKPGNGTRIEQMEKQGRMPRDSDNGSMQSVSPPFWRPRWAGYLLAMVLTGVMLLARAMIGDRLEGPTMIVFTVPIILSAYWGGLGPGLLSTVLSALGAAYFVLPPLFNFKILSMTQRTQELVLLLTGGLISVIFELFHRAQDRVEGLIAVHRPVEAAVRESERRYRGLFEHMVEGFAYCRMLFENGEAKDWIYLSVNPMFEKLTGLKDVTGRRVSEVIPGIAEADPELFKIYTRVSLTGKAERFEMFVKSLQQWFDISVYSPEKECFVAVFDVITKRKEAEQTLLEIEEKFHQITENIHEVFWITDATMHEIIYVSPAYENIWGRPCDSLYASPRQWLEVIHPDDRENVLKAVTNFQKTGIYDEEYRIIRPEGAVRWIQDRGFPVRNAAGEVYRIAGVAEDITESRNLEEQFRQAQKMETFGQLAGGVAHDFNNMLAVIMIQADLLKADANLSPQVLETATEIGNAARRASNLVRQLLMFGRREILQLRDLELNESINDTTKMLRRTLGEDIELQFRFAMQPLFIHADATMLDQVVMNLAVNARDAMPKGGMLVIETSAVDFDESVRAQSTLARPGAFVCLSVSDTGCGIPKEILPRIFEPFFTTKEAGKGTGLGLATVFGIVQQHKGWINVYSEAGRGTIFRIYLPRLAGTSGQKQEPPAPTILRGGNETILLVEDDVNVCAAARKTLSHFGYRVLEAASGIEALEVWKRHGNEIRLLITDLVMPGGMTGKDLVKTLSTENPKLKVIYMSGYSAEFTAGDLPLEEDVNFLTKPFQAQKLTKIVRDSLDKSIQPDGT